MTINSISTLYEQGFIGVYVVLKIQNVFYTLIPSP